MSTREEGGGDPEWRAQDIQRLLAEMKRSIPEENRAQSYRAGMTALPWGSVAFPPFSAAACQAKWGEILQKIRKTRSLTELINEAEDTLTNSVNQDKPLPQDANREIQVRRKQHQETGCRKRLKINEFSVSSEQGGHKFEYFLPVKPPSTGYNLFCKDQMKHITGVSKNSICMVLAQRWKELTENERKEYSTRCTELKRQYSFYIRGMMNTQKSKDLLAAKPPSTGYNLFCKEQVKQMKGISKKSYCIVLAQRWKELTETQRKEYSARCRELKQQYKNELNCSLLIENLDDERQTLDQHSNRNMRNICLNVCSLANIPTSKESEHRDTTSGEPQMPLRSSNHIFLKEEMKRLKNNFPNTTHRFALVNQKWKQMSFKEKEAYREKQNENTAKYSMELQQWFQGLSPQEQKEYLRQNPRKHQYLNAIDTAVHEFTHMPSDSEDEDITDESSDEQLFFDLEESEEEEDKDMPFMF